MEIWIWISIAVVAGALIGGGAVWLLARSGGTGPSVAELEKENQRFKAEVTDHFVETARLINQMTDSYKAVFDHLSGGAQRLVDPKDLSERLSVEHREVRLHRIGASGSSNAAAGSSKQEASPKAAKEAEPGKGGDPLKNKPPRPAGSKP